MTVKNPKNARLKYLHFAAFVEVPNRKPKTVSKIREKRTQMKRLDSKVEKLQKVSSTVS